jgi:hypothetical protein
LNAINRECDPFIFSCVLFRFATVPPRVIPSMAVRLYFPHGLNSPCI